MSANKRKLKPHQTRLLEILGWTIDEVWFERRYEDILEDFYWEKISQEFGEETDFETLGLIKKSLVNIMELVKKFEK